MGWSKQTLTVRETDVEQRKLVDVEREGEVLEGTGIALYWERPPGRTTGKQWVLVRNGTSRILTYDRKRDARQAGEVLAEEAGDSMNIEFGEATAILCKHGMYR